jgi:hypothetical protein
MMFFKNLYIATIYVEFNYKSFHLIIRIST